MAQRPTTGRRLSLKVGFEPRHGGQDVLAAAYARLLPPLSRPLLTPPRTWPKEEAYDPTADDALDPGTTHHPGPGGDLRSGCLIARSLSSHDDLSCLTLTVLCRARGCFRGLT